MYCAKSAPVDPYPHVKNLFPWTWEKQMMQLDTQSSSLAAIRDAGGKQTSHSTRVMRESQGDQFAISEGTAGIGQEVFM
jgi:hypothetical protein